VHIHRYEKFWLGASLLLIVGFIATISYGAIGAGVEMVGNDDTLGPNEISAHEEFGDQGIDPGENPGEYDVYLVAQRYSFGPPSAPGGMTVPANSTITFHVTSQDVIHGFQIVGTNVNAMVIPGEVAEITVEFDDTGTYGVLCNEYCGDYHHRMAGQITVVPESEFNATSGGDSA
jgi:cytochrome c oxidase subunit 2